MSSKNLIVKRPPKNAVGLEAIKTAYKHVSRAMHLGKALKILNKLNQKGGIDCPGCAWPDPAKRSKLGEYCENGIKAISEEAMDKTVGVDFFRKYSVQELLAQSDYWLGQQGRLTHPMIIRPGNAHYQPIEWDELFEVISSHLKSLASPDEAIFYTSGRTSNEAAFLYQLFVRMFGTNNLPDCSNMCHESSGAALKETLGIGKGSVTLEDLYKADLILIFGQNPGTNHPRMLSALEKAKNNGAKIVTINPLKEVGLVQFKNPQTAHGMLTRGTKISDLYLQLKINEDVALLKAVMKKLLARAKDQPEILDREFITSRTSGFEELQRDLDNFKGIDLIERTGLKEAEIDQLVELIVNRKNIIACWAMGLTQHQNGVDNIREVVNLLLFKGSVGKPGAGTCPVRGHSNVQGDRTMGIHERPSKALLDKISENFGFIPPDKHGYSVIEAIRAMNKGKAKVFMAMGGNFLSAAPDTGYTAQALKNCELTAHVSTKLNRSHLIHGKTGLILPCLGRSDRQPNQVLTVENSMGVVHTTNGVLPPPSKHLLAETEIVARLAKVTVKQNVIDWDYLVEDYNRIRDLIEKTVAGFENFNQKLSSDRQFELPNGARIGVFNTPDKKAHFTLNKLSNNSLSNNEYLMMTIRSHDQFNTTIYGLDDRYRGIFNGRKVVFMNKEDMELAGIKGGDKITLYNNYNDTERFVDGFSVIPYNIPKSCLATYFPEANPLVPLDLYAHTSLTPASKSIRVKIRNK